MNIDLSTNSPNKQSFIRVSLKGKALFMEKAREGFPDQLNLQARAFVMTAVSIRLILLSQLVPPTSDKQVILTEKREMQRVC